MTSSGIVDGGAIEPLFRSPFYATGFPITEAYWSTVRVGGQPRTVLMQIFERRALTYTPGNPAGFTVEAGNVGLQYRAWRAFLAIPPTPTPAPHRTAPTPRRTLTRPTPVGATAAPPAETATLAALIVDVAYDGDATSNDPNDETVVIINGSSAPLDMTGWTLRDTHGHVYTFGAFTLPVDGQVTLASGKGTDSAAKRYWGQSTGVLDNTGPETLTLRDASGALLTSYPYPSQVGFSIDPSRNHGRERHATDDDIRRPRPATEQHDIILPPQTQHYEYHSLIECTFCACYALPSDAH